MEGGIDVRQLLAKVWTWTATRFAGGGNMNGKALKDERGREESAW